MNALYRPQKKDPARGRLMYATILVIIIFLLDVISGGRLRALVRVGASAIWQSLGVTSQSVSESGIFSSRHRLEVENAELRASLAEFVAKDVAYHAMKDENTRLRVMAKVASARSGVTANVISSLAASPYGTFSIGAGINEGVSRGQVVYTDTGYALGVVSESSAYSALVTEYFSPKTNIEVIVHDTPLTLQGSGGGNAQGKAPRDSVIAVGDIVRTRSAGTPVGIVGKVVSDASSSFVQVYVRSPINLLTLSLVYVERK